MRKIFLLTLILFFGCSFAQKPNVQLILDVSGSMWLNLESGETKIDAAKTVLIDFIGGLPSDSLNMGLRLYGATVSGIDAGACTDSQLVIPVDGLDKGGLINTVQMADPKGGTPIVYALNEAIKDFETLSSDEQKLIILVTDGAESCGEDLNAAVQAVKAKGIDLQVIGFGLAANAAQTFESVGAFANAMSALELATALQETTEVITLTPTITSTPPTIEETQYAEAFLNCEVVTVLALGTVFNGTLSPESCRWSRNSNVYMDYFEVVLPQTDTLSVYSLGARNTYIYNRNGEVVADGRQIARGELQAGTYVIATASDSTKAGSNTDYRLTATNSQNGINGCAYITPIEFNQMIEGSLNADSCRWSRNHLTYIDYYQFTIPTDQSISFELEGAKSLEVLERNGNEVDYKQRTLYAGTYVVGVFNQGSTRYRLTLKAE